MTWPSFLSQLFGLNVLSALRLTTIAESIFRPRAEIASITSLARRPETMPTRLIMNGLSELSAPPGRQEKQSALGKHVAGTESANARLVLVL